MGSSPFKPGDIIRFGKNTYGVIVPSQNSKDEFGVFWDMFSWINHHTDVIYNDCVIISSIFRE